jgi:hypothetical protein
MTKKARAATSQQPPKSLQEALVAGWRESNEGVLDYWTSRDYQTLEGYIEFEMGVELFHNHKKTLCIPVKAKLIHGKPYFDEEPEEKAAAAPKRKTA